MSESDIEQLSIDTIRGLAMDMVQRAGSGHPGTAMALAPLGYVIFRRHLAANPKDPAWPGRDRFVLSSGHACVLQYALLHLCGYDLSLDDLKQFRQWGSRTPGHPERAHTPGIEVTTGPLGQGFGNAVGFALAERFLAERFNRPGSEALDHQTIAIASDGDLMEGITQEAASIAGHFGLGKLTVCYDDNHITIDGSTSISFDGEDHLARFRANGWHVQRVWDAEDLEALEAALAEAREAVDRPSFIAIRSHIAYPAPHAIDTAAAHGSALGEDEVRATKSLMGFDPNRTFWVDPSVDEHLSLERSGGDAQRRWELALGAWRERHPEMAEDWDRAWRGEPELILIATGAEVPPTLDAGRALARDGVATRVVSMPCVELFEAQDESYRQSVLPRSVTARLAVEPGASLSWWKWVGDRGDVLGIDRFGASAPGTTVLEKLGFTTEGIVSRARALLAT